MKLKIHFIARNIPSPNKHNNDVIIKIANFLSERNSLKINFPREAIPLGFQFITKYKHLYNLKNYTLKGFEINVLRYIRLPIKSIAFIFLNWFNTKSLREKEIDLFHGHFIFPDGLIAMKLSRYLNLPFIVSVRKSDWLLLKKVNVRSHTYRAAQKCLNAAHGIHVHNGFMADLLDKEFGVSSWIIPHGVDESVLNLTMNKSESQVVITCVAGFIAEKNIDWVIRSIKNYKGSQAVTLKIIGGGDLEIELKRQAKDCKQIQFLGQLDHTEVLKQMSASHIFALPSCKETFGLVYLEAAATSNALIAFNEYSINGVFSKEECVFVSDYTSFQSNIHYLIDNPKITAKIGEMAKIKAGSLTWYKIIREYEVMYKKCVGENTN